MLHTDFLIIGAGSAGLACALELAQIGAVLVVSKDTLELSASAWAQGGIAAVLADGEDSVAQHVADTLRAGAGLCEPTQVEEILAAAPAAIARLLRWGTEFDRLGEDWQRTREGGHSARRVLHRADHTGRSIIQALLHAAALHRNITLLPNTIVGALTQAAGRATGAWIQTENGQWQDLRARAVILASGGLGQVYLHSSNPSVATGDGLSLAWRAGIEIRDLEFVQFHPTTLYQPGEAAFLLSEALRGEGALLRLPNGERFMEKYDPRGELAPRDVVSRAIVREMQQHGLTHVELDMRHASPNLLAEHFPTITEHCRSRGHDPATTPLPVVPAAHYSCGGIRVDGVGRTQLPGLYAIGEVASTGLHGANRLASNSLLECIVCAHSVYADLAGQSTLPPLSAAETPQQTLAPPIAVELLSRRRQALQDLLWNQVGILREQRGMADALAQLQAWEDEFPWPPGTLPSSRMALEWQGLLRSALLITQGALQRHESRGCHYDQDFLELSAQAQHLRQRQDWDGTRTSAVGHGDASDANADPLPQSAPEP